MGCHKKRIALGLLQLPFDRFIEKSQGIIPRPTEGSAGDGTHVSVSLDRLKIKWEKRNTAISGIVDRHGAWSIGIGYQRRF